MKKSLLSIALILNVSLMLFSAKVLPNQSISFDSLNSTISNPDALDDSLDDVNGRFISVGGPYPLSDNINWDSKTMVVTSANPEGFVLCHTESNEETIPCEIALVLKSNESFIGIFKGNKKAYYADPGAPIKPGWSKSDVGWKKYQWNEFSIVLFFQNLPVLQDCLAGTYRMKIYVEGMEVDIEVINPGGREDASLVVPRWGTPASDIDLQSASGAFMVNLEIITTYSHTKNQASVPKTTIYPSDYRGTESTQFFFVHKDDERKGNYPNLDTYYPYTVDVVNKSNNQRQTIGGRLENIAVTSVQDNFWYASYDLFINQISGNTSDARAGDYVSYIVVDVQSGG